ncbi:F-box only protein 31-like isoform X2 [Babylonia areolata]|uniref:F-box only protein 31-like isoform X2 n=1 Tax=Babylonia areolata TaxID=304850 RepID=UPI003FD4684D
MGDLVRLPAELLDYVMTFLEARDVSALSMTCTWFYEMTRSDSIWQRMCKTEFNLTSLEGWGDNTTFRDVYTKVLYPYGKCLGLWRNWDIPCGFFMHVQMEPGRIAARFCRFPLSDYSVWIFRQGLIEHPPDDTVVAQGIDDPLQWFSPLFTITLREGLRCRKRCPPASVRLTVMDTWVAESRPELVGKTYYELLGRESATVRQTMLWSDYSVVRIPPTVQSPVSPVTLGLYKGTYGAHGIEIINLSLADNGYELLGDKILGDINVPAGKISLYIDLRKPLVLNRQQQSSDAVEGLQTETLEAPFVFAPHTSMPFSLPHDVISRDVGQLPASCKARYEGKGRIAAVGYRDPTFTCGHMVVFSDTYFGFYWIDLKSFSVFRLVEENWS